MLKGAGFPPPELDACREIREIEQLLLQVDHGFERLRLHSRVDFLLTRSVAGRRHGNLRVQEDYLEKIAERMDARRGP